MIAGQAIKSNVMDLAPSTKATGSNGLKSSLVKGKDSISFESLLSNKSVSETTTSRNSQNAMSNTKKSTVFGESKEISRDKAAVKESRSTSKNAKQEIEETQESQASRTTESDDKLNTTAKMVNEVKEIVLDTLEISEEKLASLMEILGLTMIDLLNPDALKQLTLENAGTSDFMALLTDEGLSQQWNNLLEQLQGVLDQNGITQQEITKLFSNDSEVNKLMDNMLADAKKAILTDSAQDIAAIEEEASAELRNLSSNAASSESTESLIDFTVERYHQEGGSSEQSNSDGDRKQEQGLTKTELSNQFLDQMVNSTKTTQAEFSQQVAHLSEIREIANQVLEQIKLVIKPAQTSMEFTLNPEHLGKVALNITSKEGVLTATFTTQNQFAKEALESQLQVFKENLNIQGLKVDAIEVNVSNFNFEGSNQMDQSNSNQQEAAKGKKTTLRMNVEDTEFLDEALASLVQGDSADYGNNFDYIA